MMNLVKEGGWPILYAPFEIGENRIAVNAQMVRLNDIGPH